MGNEMMERHGFLFICVLSDIHHIIRMTWEIGIPSKIIFPGVTETETPQLSMVLSDTSL